MSSSSESALARLIFRFVEKIDSYRRYRRTYTELSGLSDHELRDIGLERGEIDMIARKF
ncbi:MAG: DUF1127 domain-containing protein [Geminicoccaceae bacterium]|nr:DUF1127 domain-containing protein [Geminicoccaceae bacterium]MCB9942338.1 DUF1127 domain-containing protein [Geminicoccaceae bacterium]